MTRDELYQLMLDAESDDFSHENPIKSVETGRWRALSDGVTEYRLSVGQNSENGQFFFCNEFSQNGGDSRAEWEGPYKNFEDAEMAGKAAARTEIHNIEAASTEFQKMLIHELNEVSKPQPAAGPRPRL